MTRTCDLRFRKPSLYPAELRDREPAEVGGYCDSIAERRADRQPLENVREPLKFHQNFGPAEAIRTASPGAAGELPPRPEMRRSRGLARCRRRTVAARYSRLSGVQIARRGAFF